MPETAISDDYQSCNDLQDLALPFQFDDANIIIRAEGVDFPAHRFILSRASPFFKDMFSLPRGTTAQEGKPVIEVQEDAQVMHDIWALLYFGEEITVDPLPTIESTLLALRKYSFETLQTRFMEALKEKASTHPIQVFALACKANFPDVARVAAMHLLTWDIEALITCEIPDLARIRTPTLLKLLRFHRRCAEVASDTIMYATGTKSPPSSRRNEVEVGICCCPISAHSHRNLTDISGRPGDCRSWWTKYLECLQGEVKAHPLKASYKDPAVLRACWDSTSCVKCGNTMFHLLKAGEILEQKVPLAVMRVCSISPHKY